MPISLKGKQYHTVAERVSAFRAEHPANEGWGIETTIHAIDDAVVIVHATIRDPQGRIIGQGLAEEVRTDKGVNSTSALENCETSAVGRALTAAGYGGDGEYASGDEMTGALRAQRPEPPKPTNGKAMSDAQRDLIIQLSSSHVFTPEEKKRYGDWANASRSSAAASATIDRLRSIIDERKAEEKGGDAGTFEPEENLFG